MGFLHVIRGVWASLVSRLPGVWVLTAVLCVAVGGGLVVAGVAVLWGLGWALLVAGVLLVVAGLVLVPA